MKLYNINKQLSKVNMQNRLIFKSHHVLVKDLAILINVKLKNKDDFVCKYMGYIKGKILITKIPRADMFLNIIVKPITEDEIKQY